MNRNDTFPGMLPHVPTYAAWPVWNDSTTKPVRDQPMSKKQAHRLWHDARRLERQTRQAGFQDGMLGRNGLAYWVPGVNHLGTYGRWGTRPYAVAGGDALLESGRRSDIRAGINAGYGARKRSPAASRRRCDPALRQMVRHVTAPTECAQILQPIVGRVAIQVRRCEHDARHPKPSRRNSVRRNCCRRRSAT
jgi:hypothetical protein